MIKTCENEDCRKEFKGDHRRKYCSDECRAKRQKESQEKYIANNKEKLQRRKRREQKAARNKDKLTLSEAVQVLNEYNKKHGTNISYGYAVAKGII